MEFLAAAIAFMDYFKTAIAFLVIFSIIILIHEGGHFWAARRAGIKVEEFGMGLPPRIWGKKIKGVLYSINWIPFGGFVRLYGEDSSDPKILKDKKSFASQPLRKRMLVVVAGVFMNFILAIGLLTVGFSIGIEPLLVNSDDVIDAINTGVIELDNGGARVKSVDAGSSAYSAGIRDNDVVLKINGEAIVNPYVQFAVLGEPLTKDDIILDIYRDGTTQTINIGSRSQMESRGVEMYNAIYLPRVVIRGIAPDSASVRAGLQIGDTIISMNSQPIYFVSDYQEIVNTENVIVYEIIRNHEKQFLTVQFTDTERVVVAGIILDAPAAKAGFAEGDIIKSINGNNVVRPEDSIKFTEINKGEEVTYKIDRNGEEIEIVVVPSEEGRIGVGIISMASYQNNQLSVYNADVLTSVININDVQYPVHKAFVQSFTETGRLAVLTLGMFGNLVKSITSQLTVPDGVAGPVGIATMTHMFVQEGLLALLRFTALLSLSLAVINIIPFPALDGGRLLFLLIEAVRGKRIPAKWEALIHAFGFILLIALIVLVTYSDILNIFS